MVRTLHARPCLYRTVSIACVLAISILASGGAAQARVWIGFGFPLYVGPPGYYFPPPVYYPPPPAYYYPPPPAYAAPPPGYSQSDPQYSRQSCYAGSSLCPIERPVPTGASCYCPGPGGRVWGRAS